eukprot:jgi/Bigna1/133573/aug1.21_g8281
MALQNCLKTIRFPTPRSFQPWAPSLDVPTGQRLPGPVAACSSRLAGAAEEKNNSLLDLPRQTETLEQEETAGLDKFAGLRIASATDFLPLKPSTHKAVREKLQLHTDLPKPPTLGSLGFLTKKGSEMSKKHSRTAGQTIASPAPQLATCMSTSRNSSKQKTSQKTTRFSKRPGVSSLSRPTHQLATCKRTSVLLANKSSSLRRSQATPGTKSHLNPKPKRSTLEHRARHPQQATTQSRNSSQTQLRQTCDEWHDLSTWRSVCTPRSDRQSDVRCVRDSRHTTSWDASRHV